jgi:serine/threonine-protein kinase
MPYEPVAKPAAGEGLGTSADSREHDRTSTETTTVCAKSLVGQVLGGTYRILELLDEGGMGRLYRAEHVRLRRPIAVKVLANHLAHDVGALARFNREAEIVSQLHHPHIVHILDFDQTDHGAPYIVMELLEGESLARRLDRDRMLPIADVVQIVTQISGALQLAHQKGIVHRDLKPDNVFLIAIDDELVFIKLLDFGISKSLTASSKVTREFDVLGTPDYMAPEQAISTAKADHRADQFALACMTYEMLTGRMPFAGGSVAELLHKVVHENPVLPSYYAPGLPYGMDSVLMRAMAKLPDARFATIQDFAVAFAQTAGVALRQGSSPFLGHTPESPPVLASLPRRSGFPNHTPSGDFGIAGHLCEQSLPIPEVPRRGTPEAVTQPIPTSARLPSFDLEPSDRAPAFAPPAAVHRYPAYGGRSTTDRPLSDRPLSDRYPSDRPLSERPNAEGGSGARLPQRPALRSNAPTPQSPRTKDHSPTTLRSHVPTGDPLRRAAPGPRPISELEGAIADIRRALSFGEQSRAENQARRAVHLARDCDERMARQCLSAATPLLEPLLLPLLGGSHRKVELANSRVSSQGDWTPAHFFLLSRIEQPATIDELLDVSPLTRPETLCFLADLSGQGIVRVL